MSANGVGDDIPAAEGVEVVDNPLRPFEGFGTSMFDDDILYNVVWVNPIPFGGEDFVDFYPRPVIARNSRGLVAPGLSGGVVVDLGLSSVVVDLGLSSVVVDLGLSSVVVGPSHSGGGGRLVVVDLSDVRRPVVGPYHSGGGGGGRLVVVDGGGGNGGGGGEGGGGGGGGGGEGGEGGEYAVNEFGPAARYDMILAPSDTNVLELPVDFGDYLHYHRAEPRFITVRESLDENSPRLVFDVRYRDNKHRAFVTKKTWSGFAAYHGLQAGDEISFEDHGDAFLVTAQRNGVALW